MTSKFYRKVLKLIPITPSDGSLYNKFWHKVWMWWFLKRHVAINENDLWNTVKSTRLFVSGGFSGRKKKTYNRK